MLYTSMASIIRCRVRVRVRVRVEDLKNPTFGGSTVHAIHVTRPKKYESKIENGEKDGHEPEHATRVRARVRVGVGVRVRVRELGLES